MNLTGLSWRREIIVWGGGTIAALVVLALTFWAGRLSSPRPPAEVRTVTVTKEVEREKAVSQRQDSVQAVASADRHEHLRERIIERPGGVRIVERDREVGTTHSRAVSAAETRVEYRDRIVYKEAEKQQTTLTLTNDARWSLTLMAGSTVQWDRTYGALLQARVIGPFSLGIFGVTANGKPAVGLTAGVRW